MSFETEVELSLTVPRSELRGVRSEIEDGLGDISMGASGGGASGTRGSAQSQNRRLFRWARQRTQDLDTTVTLLESIDDTLDEDGGLLGGGGRGGGGGFPTILPIGGGGGGGRLPGPGGVGGLSGLLRNFAMSTGVLGLPFAQNERQVTGESAQQLAERGPIQRFFASVGSALGVNEANVDVAGANRRQRGAEVLRRQQMQRLSAPQWMQEFLSGQADPPTWVQEARQGVLFDTPSGQRAPDRPGGAERVRIDFEQTVEAQGFTPEELEQRIDGKLQEFEREIARETGRGLGGTPIP